MLPLEKRKHAHHAQAVNCNKSLLKIAQAGQNDINGRKEMYIFSEKVVWGHGTRSHGRTIESLTL